MPSLPDEMYCSEQISIPPTFPYLLRQYAKAAIRTQPIDLLKWSTAYFRCLSLNIPPPVKPRLEYPIARDFHGITPGWLKALLYQLQNNQTVPFKILWDRWIGACLEHHTLIKLLCLGGFDDVEAIPWLRFVAICAGTLTDDLTHTMMLICEILTEEPEGGSAMISLEIFLDLYKFLAKIDASKDQELKNYWFRDSLLSLWKEKVDKEEVVEEVPELLAAESDQSEATKTSSESVEKEDELDDMDKVVSCPSLPEDDKYSIDYLMKLEPPDVEVEGEGGEDLGEVEHEEINWGEEAEEEHTEHAEHAEHEEHEEGEDEEKGEEVETKDIKLEGEHVEENPTEEVIEAIEAIADDLTGKSAASEHEEDGGATAEVMPSVDAPVKSAESVVDDLPIRDLEHGFDEEDETLKEDLERLRALQQELHGETDEELEKFKCRLIEEMPLTESQEEGIKHFKIQKADHLTSDEKLKAIGEEKIHSGEVSSDSQEEEGDKRPYETVFCEAIPGIGAVVSDQLIAVVEEYMKSCAKIQHGVVMPRNIRHYSCPPLESMSY